MAMITRVAMITRAHVAGGELGGFTVAAVEHESLHDRLPLVGIRGAIDHDDIMEARERRRIGRTAHATANPRG